MKSFFQNWRNGWWLLSTQLFSNSITIVNTPETPSKAVKVSRSIPSGYGATADKELAMEFFFISHFKAYCVSSEVQTKAERENRETHSNN